MLSPPIEQIPQGAFIPLIPCHKMQSGVECVGDHRVTGTNA